MLAAASAPEIGAVADELGEPLGGSASGASLGSIAAARHIARPLTCLHAGADDVAALGLDLDAPVEVAALCRECSEKNCSPPPPFARATCAARRA